VFNAGVVGPGRWFGDTRRASWPRCALKISDTGPLVRGIPDDYLPAGRGRPVLTDIAFAQLDGNGIGIAAGNPHEGSDRRSVAVDVVRSLAKQLLLHPTRRRSQTTDRSVMKEAPHLNEMVVEFSDVLRANRFTLTRKLGQSICRPLSRSLPGWCRR
jgi:hypothetical protein